MRSTIRQPHSGVGVTTRRSDDVALTKRPRRPRSSASALALGCGLALAVFVPTAEAKTSKFSVLYTFTGLPDGSYSSAGLIADKSGNLYGTTGRGGADGEGTVFELTRNGTESELLTFDGTNGQVPLDGNLIADKAGNFYGTTGSGGNDYGVVYKLAPDGTETVLYNFLGGSDGRYPYYGLVADKDGNLYGTTYRGGSVNNNGVIFKVTPDGIETVLYTFCSLANCTDGSGPLSQLIIDKSDDLYGTTIQGGANDVGTVFEVTPAGTETVLHSFAYGTDGAIPYAGLIADKSGNFYGTTAEGGPGDRGTVFELAKGGAETVLYGFQGGTDGVNPEAALVEDSDGNLYGTTALGGSNNANCYTGSCGTVFKIAPNGTETILHTFTGGSDGATPEAALHLKDAWLYGTAELGGADGYGTVFKVKK